jgi:DNA-binding GntR family transcriptional regulator
MGISATDISQRIVEAVLAQRLAPGARLGEQQLAMLFDCSRTIVREALTRLAARGIVTVSARRGWYLIAPTPDDVREAFEARRVIELGLIRGQGRLDEGAVARLNEHLQQEQAALRGDDVGTRRILLGDLHLSLAAGPHDADRHALPVHPRRRAVLRGPCRHRRGAGRGRQRPCRGADGRTPQQRAGRPAPDGRQRSVAAAAGRTRAAAHVRHH